MNDSPTALAVAIAELRKDLDHLKEQVTEDRLQHRVDIASLLKKMDIVVKALLNEQELKLRRKISWKLAIKLTIYYGGFLVLCFIGFALAGMEMDAAAEAVRKLLKLLP